MEANSQSASKKTPITITLYDPETDEVKQTYSRAFIPWEILKAAIRLIPKIENKDVANLDEGIIDELAGLVAEAFGNKFSAQEASQGADLDEMSAVLMNIVARASSLMPQNKVNPTRPG